MNLEKLRELRALAFKKCEDLQKKAETEQRVLSDDERREFDTSLAEIDRLDGDIRRAEDFQKRQAETRETQQRPNPTVNTEVHDNREDAAFKSFGEQLMAIRAVAETRGREYDPRLRKFDLTDVKVRAASGMQEAVASDGGFLVTTDFAATLSKQAFDTGQLASRTTKIPLSANSNGVKIPYVDETSRATGSRWGGIRGYWTNEATSVTATKPKFGLLELGLNKLAVLAYMTDELLQDSSAAESYVTRAATEEFGFQLDDAIVRGAGAGVPLGILNAGCTVSVAKETSQAAATILYQNVSKMRSRMLPRSFQNAVWFINVDCMPQLEQLSVPIKNVAGTENVGGGLVVWQPPRGAADPPNGTIFGRPVIPVEQCETVGTVGDIILADLGMYLMSTKGGVMAASSIHVNFLTDETAFRFIMRVDGQPALKSAITPYKGTNSLSAFVTLATRA